MLFATLKILGGRKTFEVCEHSNFNFQLLDIRAAELVHGRSINLALSARGRKALARVGLEQKILDHAIPMRGRMLHDMNGQKRIVPYDPINNQV